MFFNNNSNIKLFRNCKNKLSSIAIQTENETFTYHELISLIRLKSNYFSKFISPNEIVPILSENSAEFIISILSLWNISATPAPINTMLTEEQIKELLDIIGANKILVSNKLNENLFIAKSFPIANYDKSEVKLPQRTISSKTKALILFTSGSTSFPKAVTFSFGNLIANAENLNSIFSTYGNDSWLASLPFYHIGGFAIIFRAVFNCAKIILPKNLSFNSLAKTIASTHPNFFSLVQTTLKRLTESDVESYNELRAVFAGGGPIDTDTMKRAIKKGFPVFKVYGSTETTSMVTYLTPSYFTEKPRSAGKPFDKIKIEISQENEIIISGEQIAEGYLNNLEQTNIRFRKNKFYSGDIGFIDKDGFLFIEGRKEEFIISGGENVNLQKIKKVLLSLDFIDDAESFSLPDNEWGEKLCVVVVTKHKITKQKLKQILSTKLGKFEIPKEFFFVNKIPRNPLGKLLKEELKNKIQMRSNSPHLPNQDIS